MRKKSRFTPDSGSRSISFLTAGRLSLRGYRLPSPGARAYRPILPQAARWASAVLGLDLVIEDSRLRFYAGNAPLLETDELITRLNAMMDQVVVKRFEAEGQAEDERRRADQERAQAEDERRRADAEKRRADDAEEQLAKALIEIKRLQERR
jgi:hypothetical protein